MCHRTTWASFVGNSSTFTIKWMVTVTTCSIDPPQTPRRVSCAPAPFFLWASANAIWCSRGGENLKSPINLGRFELFESLLAAYQLRNTTYWTPDWSFAINDASLEVSPCCFRWETGHINICVNSNTLPPWSKGMLVEFIGKPCVEITGSRRNRASSSFTSTP